MLGYFLSIGVEHFGGGESSRRPPFGDISQGSKGAIKEAIVSLFLYP